MPRSAAGAQAALARAWLLRAAAGFVPAACAEAVARGTSSARLRAGVDQGLAVSLLQVKASRVEEHGVQAPASFFDDFPQGESTYNADATQRRPQGWDLHPDKTSAKLGGLKAAVFYHESESGGSKQAFQTHYPALSSSPGNRDSTVGDWTTDGAGRWHQEYEAVSLARTPEHKEASWFDNEVLQYDGLGRYKLPDEVHYSNGTSEVWEERTVNTTIACAEAGCTATARLQAFDAATEKGKDCRLNVHIHPTDFDDQYSGERLTYIKVNGVLATTDCFPMVSGCNASTQRHTFPCLSDMSLDNIIQADGAVTVETQIPEVVDECPYNGNLLSGVPTVTCLVSQKESPPPQMVVAGAAPVQPLSPGVPPEMALPYVAATMPLRCPERGCTAVADVELSIALVPVKTCLMDVVLYQTDFDDLEGTNELVEFIKVGSGNTSKTLAEDVKPGGNPCRQMWKDGTTRTEAETEYRALAKRDVTEDALGGVLRVAAKISDSVDECAHNGYLLNGYVTVNCTVGDEA